MPDSNQHSSYVRAMESAAHRAEVRSGTLRASREYADRESLTTGHVVRFANAYLADALTYIDGLEEQLETTERQRKLAQREADDKVEASLAWKARAERAEEQLEAERRANVGLSADLSRFGEALAEISETPVEEDAKDGWTRELQRIAREALNPAISRQDDTAGCVCGGCEKGDHNFDRSLCACGAMHYYCNECGGQCEDCSPASVPQKCECGHLEAAHDSWGLGAKSRCRATVYTEAPMGGGSAYTCHCQDFSPASSQGEP